MNGIDYSWGRPGGQAIKEQGYEFVCRYLSNDPSKNINNDEAKDLQNNGLDIVLVWEDTASRALSGFTGGQSDARVAVAQANSMGFTGPIYFAVDFDAAESQQAAINQYMKGAASVVGKDRMGVYGGFYVVKRCLDAEVVTYAWQTTAWSGNQKDPRIHIFQNAITVPVNGVQCDVNQSLKDDFGQQGDDMAVKVNKEIARYVLYGVGYNGVLHKENALAGDLDAEIDRNHVGKDFNADYIRGVFNSAAAKDSDTTLHGFYDEAMKLRQVVASPDEAAQKLDKIKEILGK